MKTFIREALERVAKEAAKLERLANQGVDIEPELEQLLAREEAAFVKREWFLLMEAALYGESVPADDRARAWPETLMNQPYKVGDVVVVTASALDLDESGALFDEDSPKERGYQPGEVFTVGVVQFGMDGIWLLAKNDTSLLLNQNQVELSSNNTEQGK